MPKEITVNLKACLTGSGGGNTMYSVKIDKSIDGFPDSNNYKITLNKPIYNISAINLYKSLHFYISKKVNTANGDIYIMKYRNS